jgi:hypothetical protein
MPPQLDVPDLANVIDCDDVPLAVNMPLTVSEVPL